MVSERFGNAAEINVDRAIINALTGHSNWSEHWYIGTLLVAGKHAILSMDRDAFVSEWGNEFVHVWDVVQERA